MIKNNIVFKIMVSVSVLVNITGSLRASAMDASAKGYNWAKIGTAFFGTATAAGAYLLATRPINIAKRTFTKADQESWEKYSKKIQWFQEMKASKEMADAPYHGRDEWEQVIHSWINEVGSDSEKLFDDKEKKDFIGKAYDFIQYPHRPDRPEKNEQCTKTEVIASMDSMAEKLKSRQESLQGKQQRWQNNYDRAWQKKFAQRMMFPALTGLAAVGCWWKVAQQR